MSETQNTKQNNATSEEEFPYFGCGVHELPSDDSQLIFVGYNADGRPFWENIYSYKDPHSEWLVNKYFSRFVYPYLNESTMRVLMFIVDRTIGWGKKQERIKIRHFIKGIDGITVGTSLGKTSVYKALKFLEDKGLIKRYEDIYEVSYSGIANFLVYDRSISKEPCGIIDKGPRTTKRLSKNK